jgi:hypothetical protein
LTTILVDGNPNDPADYKIPTILELGPVVEAIFRRQGDKVTR